MTVCNKMIEMETNHDEMMHSIRVFTFKSKHVIFWWWGGGWFSSAGFSSSLRWGWRVLFLSQEVITMRQVERLKSQKLVNPNNRNRDVEWMRIRGWEEVMCSLVERRDTRIILLYYHHHSKRGKNKKRSEAVKNNRSETKTHTNFHSLTLFILLHILLIPQFSHS